MEEYNEFTNVNIIGYTNVTLENREKIRDFTLDKLEEYSIVNNTRVKPYIISDDINYSNILDVFMKAENDKILSPILVDGNLNFISDIIDMMVDVRNISSEYHTMVLYIESLKSMINRTLSYNNTMSDSETIRALLDSVEEVKDFKIIILDDVTDSGYTNNTDINIRKTGINIHEDIELLILADML